MDKTEIESPSAEKCQAGIARAVTAEAVFNRKNIWLIELCGKKLHDADIAVSTKRLELQRAIERREELEQAVNSGDYDTLVRAGVL